MKERRFIKYPAAFGSGDRHRGVKLEKTMAVQGEGF
jgi:hypothetical protein